METTQIVIVCILIIVACLLLLMVKLCRPKYLAHKRSKRLAKFGDMNDGIDDYFDDSEIRTDSEWEPFRKDFIHANNCINNKNFELKKIHSNNVNVNNSNIINDSIDIDSYRICVNGEQLPTTYKGFESNAYDLNSSDTVNYTQNIENLKRSHHRLKSKSNKNIQTTQKSDNIVDGNNSNIYTFNINNYIDNSELVTATIQMDENNRIKSIDYELNETEITSATPVIIESSDGYEFNYGKDLLKSLEALDALETESIGSRTRVTRSRSNTFDSDSDSIETIDIETGNRKIGKCIDRYSNGKIGNVDKIDTVDKVMIAGDDSKGICNYLDDRMFMLD